MCGLQRGARREPAGQKLANGGSDPGIRRASPAKSLVHSYRRVTGRYRRSPDEFSPVAGATGISTNECSLSR